MFSLSSKGKVFVLIMRMLTLIFFVIFKIVSGWVRRRTSVEPVN